MLEETKVKRLTLAFLLFFVFTVHAHAFVNGSFESGIVSTPFQTEGVGSTFLAPWTIVGGNIDVIGNYWPAADGNQSIDLNGGEAGTIQQTIPTTNGCTYHVTFALSGNSGSGVLKEMDVYVNAFENDPIASFSTTRSAQAGEWEDETFSFTANSPGPSTTVYFRSLTQGAYGPAIDNVRVEEECPPSSIPTLNEWGMIIFMALAGLIAVYHLRKQIAA